MADPSLFAFIGLNPVHAVGFEQLGRKFHLLTTRSGDLTDLLARRGTRVASHLDSEERARSSESILALEATAEYLVRHEIRDLIMFKVSARAETRAGELGCRILMSPPRLARRLENKLCLERLAREARILAPRSQGMAATDADFERMAASLGVPFVAQAPKSFSGAKTYFIDSQKGLDDLREQYGTRPLRFSSFIDGEYVAVTGCVTAGRTLIAPPAFQITGIPECTPHRLGSCGNDLAFGDTERWTAIIRPVVSRVGAHLREQGFLGVFGIDVVVTPTEVFLIDLNPRLLASLPLYTALQRESSLTPFAKIHLHLHAGESLGSAERESFERMHTNASSVLVYNTADTPVRIARNMRAGIYELTTMAFLREAVDVTEASGSTEALILAQPSGTLVQPGAEMARIYARYSVMRNVTELTYETRALVALLRKRLSQASSYRPQKPPFA